MPPKISWTTILAPFFHLRLQGGSCPYGAVTFNQFISMRFCYLMIFSSYHCNDRWHWLLVVTNKHPVGVSILFFWQEWWIFTIFVVCFSPVLWWNSFLGNPAESHFARVLLGFCWPRSLFSMVLPSKYNLQFLILTFGQSQFSFSLAAQWDIIDQWWVFWLVAIVIFINQWCHLRQTYLKALYVFLSLFSWTKMTINIWQEGSLHNMERIALINGHLFTKILFEKVKILTWLGKCSWGAIDS